ncbi:TetR/AcrR family transcriptional regulator [Kineosporiaceae bacterium B12]|nr:TetR/AcrR family transcriptional regulator [Kineococcus rubinsiae]
MGRPRAARTGGPPQGAREPRAEILDAAAELFTQLGYAGTSTRAIAERVGIRQASLYYHFAGKDELLLELLENSVRPTLDLVAAIEARADRAEVALHALVSVDVATLLRAPHNVGTLYAAHEVQQPGFDSFRRHRAELLAAYTRLAAASAPQSPDPDLLGALCLQVVELVIPLRRDGTPGPGVADDLAAACLRVVGLAPAAVDAAVADGHDLLAALSPVTAAT